MTHLEVCVAHDGDRVETLVVIGPGLADLVGRQAQFEARAEFLKARLPVQPGADSRGVVHQGIEQVVEQSIGSRLPGGDEDRPEQGLQGVGKDRRLAAATGGDLATAQQQLVPQPE